MRLSPKEIATFKKVISQLDPEAEIYLYGSRVRDDLKGGDIDLLVISETLGFSAKVTILVESKLSLGDQKIDLSVKTREEATADAFFSTILKTALLL